MEKIKILLVKSSRVIVKCILGAIAITGIVFTALILMPFSKYYYDRINSNNLGLNPRT